MPPNSGNPAAGGAAGLKNDVSLPAEQHSPNSPQNFEKQVTIAALNREYEAESARLQVIASARAASIKLTHVGDNFSLHDFEDGKRAFEAARQYGAEVASHIKKMEAALDAEGNTIIAEAFRL